MFECTCKHSHFLVTTPHIATVVLVDWFTENARYACLHTFEFSCSILELLEAHMAYAIISGYKFNMRCKHNCFYNNSLALNDKLEFTVDFVVYHLFINTKLKEKKF